MISEKQKAPAFSCKADDGSIVDNASLLGMKVVIYFYPKDDTPGCTTQACGFRDMFPRFSTQDCVILGVSPDSIESHLKFKAKFQLPFMLLADEDHAMAEAFGVWKEKSMFGKKYMGNERTTFILDREGNVAKIFPKVKPEGHAQEVEDVIKQLS